MIDSNVTTITLDGNEIKVEFGSDYPYYQITNKGDTDIYASMSPNITPESDGVYTVSAGGSEIIGEGYSFNTFYILGTGKVYIRGKRDAMSASFKSRGKGGDGGFSGDYNDLTNKPDIPVPSEVIDSNSTNETVSTSKAVFDYVTISDNTTLASANSYTDTAIADLVGTAPDTLNTLEELAAAVQNNETVVEALDSAITNKADKASLSAHTDNKNNPHEVKQSDIGLIFDGSVLKNKTVGEAKEIIINTYLSNFGRFGVFMNIPSKLIDEWDTNDYVLSSGSVCQITPIGTVTKGTADGKLYGRFLISGYFRKVYVFDISESVCTELSQILTSDDITSSVEMYELGNINMTVGEFKNLIYNWYCSGRTDKVSKIQGAVCNVTRNFIDYWSDDDYTLTPSTKWSIISIGAFQSNADTNMCCGLFLLSSYYNNVVYLLSLVNGVFNAPKALATSDGLLTNEERAKLDSITPEMIQKLKNL